MQPLLVREVELVNISVLEHKKLAGVYISLKKAEMGPFHAVTAQGDAQILEESLSGNVVDSEIRICF